MTKLPCCLLLAVAACGPARPTATTTTPSPAAEVAPATPPPAVAEPTTPPPAVTPTPPPVDGCRWVNAEGQSGGEPSIISLPGGEKGYTMPQICPAQACSAGLTISLPNRGGWKPGVYDIVVATDLGTKTCHVTLRDPGPSTRPADCHKARELTARCAPPQYPNVGPIMIGGAPPRVDVKIALDGRTLVDETLRPRYSNKRWDGWDCAPVCQSAKGSVSVP